MLNAIFRVGVSDVTLFSFLQICDDLLQRYALCDTSDYDIYVGLKYVRLSCFLPPAPRMTDGCNTVLGL